jgi:hypothetical protein
MTLYLNLATRTITAIEPQSQMFGSLTINIPTTIDILSAIVESVRHMNNADGYVSITIQ